MTYGELLIIREMLRKVVVRGDEETLLLRVVDKIDAILEQHNRKPAA